MFNRTTCSMHGIANPIQICKVKICLSQCSVNGKKHQDHGNSYKEKYLTGACLQFYLSLLLESGRNMTRLSHFCCHTLPSMPHPHTVGLNTTTPPLVTFVEYFYQSSKKNNNVIVLLSPPFL